MSQYLLTNRNCVVCRKYEINSNEEKRRNEIKRFIKPGQKATNKWHENWWNIYGRASLWQSIQSFVQAVRRTITHTHSTAGTHQTFKITNRFDSWHIRSRFSITKCLLIKSTKFTPIDIKIKTSGRTQKITKEHQADVVVRHTAKAKILPIKVKKMAIFCRTHHPDRHNRC